MTTKLDCKLSLTSKTNRIYFTFRLWLLTQNSQMQDGSKIKYLRKWESHPCVDRKVVWKFIYLFTDLLMSVLFVSLVGIAEMQPNRYSHFFCSQQNRNCVYFHIFFLKKPFFIFLDYKFLIEKNPSIDRFDYQWMCVDNLCLARL